MDKERDKDRSMIQGPQGVDLDPQVDPPVGNSQPIKDAQKGAGTEDGDPTQAKDQPAENSKQS